MTLKQTIARGFLLVSLAALFTQGTLLLSKILLARILKPEDFGLVAIALIFVNLLSLVSDAGFGTALVQRRKNIDKALASAFYFLPLLGLLCTGVLWALAPAIESFFNTPGLASVLRILSITFTIQSFGVTPYSIIQRSMQFNKTFVVDVSSAFAYLGVALYLAVNGYGVWSIVLGYVATNLVKVIMSYITTRYRPKQGVDVAVVKELAFFGTDIVSITILSFLLTQGDNFIMGKLFGAAALGYYALAYGIVDVSIANFSHTLSRVVFPLFCNLESGDKLTLAYEKTLHLIILATAPMAAGIAIIAPSLVPIIFGASWNPAIPLMQIIALHAAFRAPYIIASMFFQSIGNLKGVRNIVIAETVIALSLTPPFSYFFSYFGVALAFTLARVIAATYTMRCAMQHCKLEGHYYRLLKSTLPTGIMSVFLLVHLKFYTIITLPQLLIEIGFGIIIYFIALSIIEQTFVREVITITKTLFQPKKEV